MTQEDARLIQAKTLETAWNDRWGYFTGPHPRFFVTPKLARVFGAYAERMGERNFVSLAIKARLARMQVMGWDGPDAKQAQTVWEESRLPQRQDRLIRWSLGYGESWIITDLEKRLLIPNKPTLVAGIEDIEDPDEWRVIGKHWTATDERGKDVTRITLWYADHTERWEIREGTWALLEEQQTSLERPPGVRVAPYGDGPNLVDTITPGQDRINKIGSSCMVATEFSAFRQMLLFTRQDVQDGDVEAQPGEAIILDPGDEDWKAAVEELSVTPLDNYTGAKNSEVDDLMTLASLPRHMRVNPGAAPSGDAIKADEGPLIEDVEDHKREMGEALADAMGLLDIDAEPIWKDSEVSDDLGNAQVFATLVAGGIPWQEAAKEALGWDDKQVEAAEAVKPEPVAPTGEQLLAGAAEEQ